MPAPDDSLLAAFLAALPDDRRSQFTSDSAEILAAHVEAARGADPTLEAARFVATLATLADSPAALAALRARDLALAAACARGDAAALAAFDATLLPEVDAALSRFRGAPITRDELRQAMRARLLVGDPPRIATYQGRGDLRAWLRMAATRYLVDTLRADAARPDRVAAADDALADAATTSDDPQLAFLKHTYRAEFRASFRAALAALEPRDRNILRHRYLDGLEVAELSTIYGIHRVNMSKTLTRIRTDLLAAIRRDFLRRLGLGARELDDVMELIASQLELSLSGLLRG